MVGKGGHDELAGVWAGPSWVGCTGWTGCTRASRPGCTGWNGQLKNRSGHSDPENGNNNRTQPTSLPSNLKGKDHSWMKNGSSPSAAYAMPSRPPELGIKIGGISK